MTFAFIISLYFHSELNFHCRCTIVSVDARLYIHVNMQSILYICICLGAGSVFPECFVRKPFIHSSWFTDKWLRDNFTKNRWLGAISFGKSSYCWRRYIRVYLYLYTYLRIDFSSSFECDHVVFLLVSFFLISDVLIFAVRCLRFDDDGGFFLSHTVNEPKRT